MGQGRTSITEHRKSKGKSCYKSPLISSPSLSHSKEKGRGMLRFGRGDGMWADTGIKDSCLVAGSFL